MTLRFRPESGGNARILANGVPEHLVYFPPNQLPESIYQKLSPYSSNANLRRGTVIAHEQGLYIENTRRKDMGYTRGTQHDIPRERVPQGGFYVQLPTEQGLEWGYLTHYVEPQIVEVGIGTRDTSHDTRSAQLARPRPAPQEPIDDSHRIRDIRRILIQWTREIKGENQEMKGKEAWKQAVEEYDRDFGIPWFRPDLRLRRRTMIAWLAALGLTASGVGAVDYLVNGYPHAESQFTQPTTPTVRSEIRIEGTELPNAQTKLETLTNVNSNQQYVALTVTVPQGQSLVLYVDHGVNQDVGVFPESNPNDPQDDLTNWRKQRSQSDTPIFKQQSFFPGNSGPEILILNQITRGATDLVVIQGDSAGNTPQFVARLASSKQEAEKIAGEIKAKYKLGNLQPVEKDDYKQTHKTDQGFQ